MVAELCANDRWRANEPVQDRLIQHGDGMRGPGPVQDGLPVHLRRNQLLRPFVILTCRDEQRPRVLGRLEQPRYQDRDHKRSACACAGYFDGPRLPYGHERA